MSPSAHSSATILVAGPPSAATRKIPGWPQGSVPPALKYTVLRSGERPTASTCVPAGPGPQIVRTILPVAVEITATRSPMAATNVPGTLPETPAAALVVLVTGGRVVAVVEVTAGPGLVAGGGGWFTVGVMPWP